MCWLLIFSSNTSFSPDFLSLSYTSIIKVSWTAVRSRLWCSSLSCLLSQMFTSLVLAGPLTPDSALACPLWPWRGPRRQWNEQEPWKLTTRFAFNPCHLPAMWEQACYLSGPWFSPLLKWDNYTCCSWSLWELTKVT